jgi:hypothetical protein
MMGICSQSEHSFRVVHVKLTCTKGKVYSIGDELFPVFGYANRDILSQVLKRNRVETISIRNGQVDRTKILQAFQLPLATSHLNLIDYRGFLAIALEGKGAGCDKVRDYLLTMEQKARVDTVVYDNTGFITGDFQDVGSPTRRLGEKYADDPTIQTMLESQRTSVVAMRRTERRLLQERCTLVCLRELVKLRVRQIETEKDVKQLQDNQTSFRQQIPITSN